MSTLSHLFSLASDGFFGAWGSGQGQGLVSQAGAIPAPATGTIAAPFVTIVSSTTTAKGSNALLRAGPVLTAKTPSRTAFVVSFDMIKDPPQMLDDDDIPPDLRERDDIMPNGLMTAVRIYGTEASNSAAMAYRSASSARNMASNALAKSMDVLHQLAHLQSHPDDYCPLQTRPPRRGVDDFEARRLAMG